MTKRDLEIIRRKLLAQRALVLESLRRNTEYAISEMEDSTRDAADLASASHDRDVFYRLRESDARALKQIDEVLGRIGQDGYGICEQCGNEIGRTRLEALPSASKCLTCQEQADLREDSAAADLYSYRGRGAA